MVTPTDKSELKTQFLDRKSPNYLAETPSLALYAISLPFRAKHSKSPASVADYLGVSIRPFFCG
jgi:hypothetical protein